MGRVEIHWLGFEDEEHGGRQAKGHREGKASSHLADMDIHSDPSSPTSEPTALPILGSTNRLSIQQGRPPTIVHAQDQPTPRLGLSIGLSLQE